MEYTIKYRGVTYPCEMISTVRYDNGALIDVSFTDKNGVFHTAFNQDQYKLEPRGYNSSGILHLSFKKNLSAVAE